jgi:hypothetical protein
LDPKHQKELDEIAEEIFAYVSQIWVIKDFFGREFSKYFKDGAVIASPFLNSRDAMFHYQKMYDAAIAQNDEGFTEEYVCIKEHLNRGLKDFTVYLCFNLYVKILHEMIYKKARAMGKDIQHRLRHIYHNLKNIISNLRIDGQAIERDKTTDRLNDMIKEINELYILLRADKSLMKLYERCARTVIDNIKKRAKIKI